MSTYHANNKLDAIAVIIITVIGSILIQYIKGSNNWLLFVYVYFICIIYLISILNSMMTLLVIVQEFQMTLFSELQAVCNP